MIAALKERFLVWIRNSIDLRVHSEHYKDTNIRICFQIGLMRGGRFLAEEAPDELIRRYNAENLEDVFLKLSVLQNMGKRRRSSILAEIVEKVELPSIPVSKI